MKTDESTELLVMGRFGAAYGVKGWIKIISFTEPPENILDYRDFKIRENGQLRDIEIDHSRAQGKGFVGHVVGCDDRELCRLYTGKELLLSKSALPDLAADSYYWHQLQGLRVLNVQGQIFGEVDHLIETGANDVLVVRSTPQSMDERERLIPYLVDRVIQRVDLEAGEITVDWDADY